jgi:type II secretory pathway pseudopilin PulG
MQDLGAAAKVDSIMGVMPMRGARGFTYIMILLAMALIGATLASAGVIWHTVQQRERERELLYVGNQIRLAIGRYYAAGPGGARQFPQSLQDLLRDPRSPGVTRYLRKIYYDPITGTPEWGLIKTPGSNRIMGVYSLSEERPLKQANFDLFDREFEGKEKYSQWTFVYQPGKMPLPANTLPGNAPTPAQQSKQWSSTNY